MTEKIIYYYLPLFADITGKFAFAAILTAVIETLFFGIFYRENKKFLTVVFFANLVSNVLLNLFLFRVSHYVRAFVVGEISVLLFEFAVFYLYLKPEKKEIIKIFLLTFAANLISFSAGCLLLGLA
ncbi:MAG: hypothetical protein K6C94_01180 [Candidatus Gastranaerophilales bacterium]|nr:hypothetical protein [Candidatus Gastranaerophilales bacterium]